MVCSALLVSACETRTHKPRLDPAPVSSIAAAGGAVTAFAEAPRGEPVPASAPAARGLFADALLRGAPQAGAMTFEEAVRRAVASHPSVARAMGRLGQQSEVLNEARAGYRPRVNWGVDSSYDTQGQDGYSPALSISASHTIFDFGKVDGRVKVAEAGIEGRRSQILIAVDELARETAQAAIEAQRNEALRVIARDQIEDISSILDLVRARTDKGASTRSDEIQAEARVQAAQSTLLEIEAQARRWQSALSSLTASPAPVNAGAPAPQWLARACNSPEPDWSLVPAVMEAEAGRAAAMAELDLTRAQAMPTLSLDAGAGSRFDHLGSREPDYRIGLNVGGNLYNGGETQARRAAATHALQASEAAGLEARLTARRTLLEARGQIESMRGLLSSLASRQSMMRETRDLYRAQYLELGTRTLLDLLNAAQELHAARFDGVNIEHDLRRLAIDCGFSTGRLREYFALTGPW
ncbi:TolC family protein [Aureimonas populi]|uniref:TolC family protein n=1 Tax=Aureimonas populi TaxID=1701758 RepID=A0ABW5CN98_9HYPH|nr:TolC family protein [Aureimonas populi]